MSIRLFRTFIAVAETGSFVGAASKMFVTQAAVSQQMKRLETELQISLFNRDARSPEMTQAAKALVPQARDILKRYDQLIALATSKNMLAGEISIGAVSSLMGNMVPRALKQLSLDFPGVHIRITPNLSADLLEQVQRGALDAAVMSKPARINASQKWLPLAEEKLMLAIGKDEDETDAKALLTNRPYLRMARHAWISGEADAMLDEMGLSLRDVMELDSLETIAGMISHGLGVAIIPKPCIGDAITGQLTYIDLDAAPRFRTIGVLSRQDNASYEIIGAFEQALLKVLEA